MLDATGVWPGDSLIGGGASTLADAMLARGFGDVTVLDVSATGMQYARRRSGPAGRLGRDRPGTPLSGLARPGGPPLPDHQPCPAVVPARPGPGDQQPGIWRGSSRAASGRAAAAASAGISSGTNSSSHIGLVPVAGRAGAVEQAARGLIAGSPALQDAQRRMFAGYETALASLLAGETGAAPGSAEPFVAAAALVAVLRAAFESPAASRPAPGRESAAALRLLRAGLGSYAVATRQ